MISGPFIARSAMQQEHNPTFAQSNAIAAAPAFAQYSQEMRRFLAVLIGLLPTTAMAQSIISDGIEGCDFVSGQLHANCIPNFIAHLIEVIFMFTGVICLVMLIIGGYQYILGDAMGSSKDKARATIRFAITGMIVSAMSFFIIDFVVSTIAGG